MRLGTFLSLLRSGWLGLLPSVVGAVRRGAAAEVLNPESRR